MYRVIVMCLALCICLAVQAAPDQGADNKAGTPKSTADSRLPSSVKAVDLIKNIKIIGTLGYPWGEIITIRGSVYEHDDGKNTRTWLRVTHVNGKELKSPVDIFVGQIGPIPSTPLAERVEIVKGKTWELRGFESGIILDYPPKAMEEIAKIGGDGYDYIKFGFRFVPRFDYISGKEVAANMPSSSAPAKKLPVILDTDIGDDIDDTWALVMLLKSPQMDVKLITTTNGKSVYRAKIIAKLLTVANRSDIPIGLGAGGSDGMGGQQPWVKDFDLAGYKGKIHKDGVQALIDAINASPSPVTIISIGPSNTVAAALERQPGIAAKANFVGMQGSVYKGYDGGKPAPEWNVKAAVPEAQKVFSAPWHQAVITPLDTCGLINLTGERFKKLTASNDPLLKALMETYRIWANNRNVDASTILFDTVAVYLALPGPKPLLKMEDLHIKVTGDGMTVIDPAGARMTVATEWKDLDGFRDLLLKILLSE